MINGPEREGLDFFALEQIGSTIIFEHAQQKTDFFIPGTEAII